MLAPDLPSSETETGFVCASNPWLETECAGLEFYKEQDGRQYCILHFPGNKSGFWEAINDKLKRDDFNFQGVWFPCSWDFKHRKFTADVNFERAHFDGEVDFSGATFVRAANFSHCSFNQGAYFPDATFNSVSFEGSRFGSSGQFARSKFRGATSFRGCKFDGSGGFAWTIFEDNVDFLGVTFRQTLANEYDAEFDCADFTNAKFRARVDFGAGRFKNIARFTAAVFEGVVDLSNGVYEARADFAFCEFRPVSFLHCKFRESANFNNTTFHELAQFSRASFEGELDFSDSRFSGNVYFSDATFHSRVRFAGSENNSVFDGSAALDLQFAMFQKPSQVSFHTLSLRPHWFININATNFDFVNIGWSNLISPSDPKYTSLNDEVNALRQKRVTSPFRMISIACRCLATNAEENHRYDDASEFRLWAMRAGQFKSKPMGAQILHWVYYLASGYGEQVGRATLVLALIWLFFAMMFVITGHIKIAEPARLKEYAKTLVAALTYSLQVMTLQRPDKPQGVLTPFLASVEAIVGPVQAALLALAIRRRFMR